jgi:outer membrane protein assembly factor BamA
VKLLAVAVALAGCASSRAVCGDGWAALSTEHAHVVATGVTRRDATTIAAVRIAGVDDRVAAMLRRELATRPGDVLLDAPIPDDLRRLWKLGVLDDMRVTARARRLYERRRR